MGRFMQLALKRAHTQPQKAHETLTSKLQSNDMLAKNATSNVSFCPIPCPSHHSTNHPPILSFWQLTYFQKWA